jgi:hypothetical protein
MFRAKVAEKIKTHFLFNNFFSPRKSCPLWDNVEKYGRVEEDTGDTTIRRMRFTCRITKATDTHSHTLVICNTYSFSTATKFRRTRLNMTLYAYRPPCCISLGFVSNRRFHRCIHFTKQQWHYFYVTVSHLWYQILCMFSGLAAVIFHSVCNLLRSNNLHFLWCSSTNLKLKEYELQNSRNSEVPAVTRLRTEGSTIRMVIPGKSNTFLFFKTSTPALA